MELTKIKEIERKLETVKLQTIKQEKLATEKLIQESRIKEQARLDAIYETKRRKELVDKKEEEKLIRISVDEFNDRKSVIKKDHREGNTINKFTAKVDFGSEKFIEFETPQLNGFLEGIKIRASVSCRLELSDDDTVVFVADTRGTKNYHPRYSASNAGGEEFKLSAVNTKLPLFSKLKLKLSGSGIAKIEILYSRGGN